MLNNQLTAPTKIPKEIKMVKEEARLPAWLASPAWTACPAAALEA